MHPISSRPSALLAALLSVLIAPACDGGAIISLQLRTAENGTPPADASQLRGLTVIIDDGDQSDRHSFELDHSQQVTLPPLSVARSAALQIEAWGCTRSSCEQADVTLRGCTVDPIDVSERRDTVVVSLQMHDINDRALANCPGVSAGSE